MSEKGPEGRLVTKTVKLPESLLGRLTAFPGVSFSHVLRTAAELGLKAIEQDPAILLRASAPSPGRKPSQGADE